MIETKRLIIQPLTHDQLLKYIKSDHSLEKELNINETSRTISAELKEAFEQTILPNVADKSKDYLYNTLWTIISKSEKKMVGDICIVGEPNSDGEIEIGYFNKNNKNILVVRDNGIGISENANDSLGMSLIKSLVEMNLNGVLRIENNNGTLVQIEWEE